MGEKNVKLFSLWWFAPCVVVVFGFVLRNLTFQNGYSRKSTYDKVVGDLYGTLPDSGCCQKFPKVHQTWKFCFF